MFNKILLLSLYILFSSTAFSNSAQITLDWSNLDKTNSYKLYRSKTYSTNLEQNSIKNILPKNWTKTEFIDKGIQENTQYYYWLKNCQTNGLCSNFNSFVGIYIPSSTAIISNKPKQIVRKKAKKTQIANTLVKPIKPKKVKIKKTKVVAKKPQVKQTKSLPKNNKPKWKTKVTLDWSNIKANYYKVNRSMNNFNNFGKPILPDNFTATEFVDENLESNTSYYYWIKTCETRNSCSDFSSLVGVLII